MSGSVTAMNGSGRRVHAFTDDALGDHDAVALAALVRGGAVSPAELAGAAAERARAVEPRLHGLAHDALDAPRRSDDRDAALFGVPTFIKDNTDVAGMPTNHGSEAFRARAATRDDPYARQFLTCGMSVLGKTRLPEFGFNASTEFMTLDPVHNPWDTEHTVGASSGGSAAYVAAGVVPIAHANDGGGSIRIPAACAGLVGLKPTRHRHVDGAQARLLPINMESEGVVTRTVRDTAAFVAAMENSWRNPELPPIGTVLGPASRRLRVGLVLDSVIGTVDTETRQAVAATAAVLERMGHVVEPVVLPVTRQFVDDFVQYWSLLADLASTSGRFALDRSFDRSGTDGLTQGLRRQHRRRLHRTPVALHRLRRIRDDYARMFRQLEVVLSPVVAHTTPRLGHLSPTLDFDTLLERLTTWVAYTPLNNVAGTPAISLPMGTTSTGLPIGVELSAAHGDERTLLELAFALEAARPFARIQD